MMNINLTACAAAISLALSCGTAWSQEKLSKNQYKANKDSIEADAKQAKSACDRLSGNAKDICVAEAKGKEKVAKAELEARYKNTDKARRDAIIAKADAEYSVAKEKCDDKSGQDKNACMKEAKAAQTSAKAEAKAPRKTS